MTIEIDSFFDFQTQRTSFSIIINQYYFIFVWYTVHDLFRFLLPKG